MAAAVLLYLLPPVVLMHQGGAAPSGRQWISVVVLVAIYTLLGGVSALAIHPKSYSDALVAGVGAQVVLKSIAAAGKEATL